MKKIIYLLTLLTLAWTITSTSQAAGKHPANYIDINNALQSDEYIVSGNEFFFGYLHGDGNFAIYKGTGPHESYGKVWETGTRGPIGDYSMMIDDDGNIVIYSGKPSRPNRLMWSTKFQFEYPYARYFNIQDDGNLSLFNGNNPGDQRSELAWNTNMKIEINWPKHAKYIVSNYIGDLVGYMMKDGGTLSLEVRAQKWYFTPEGEIKPNDDMTKCLSIIPGKSRMPLTLEKCNGSDAQKGWKHLHGKMRNDVYPNGCIVATRTNDAVNQEARFEDHCSYNDPRIIWSLR